MRSATTVPSNIKKPWYVTEQRADDRKLSIKTPEEIKRARDACKLSREVLEYAQSLVRPGVTPIEIDRLCHDFIVQRNAYPSPLGYHGFPKSLCTSVNNVVCHGIPDKRELIDGDLVSIDITVFKNGFHGDNCATFLVGNVNEKGRELVKVSHNALMTGMSKVKPGVPLNQVGTAIEAYAKSKGYSIIGDFCGHGIGRDFHELPYVYHFDTPANRCVLEAGMIFTIEPIISENSSRWTRWKDAWTIATVDGARCAQFEHTVLVTEEGFEILTQ